MSYEFTNKSFLGYFCIFLLKKLTLKIQNVMSSFLITFRKQMSWGLKDLVK